MEYRHVRVRIVGTPPGLLMQSDKLSNKRYPLTRELAEYTSKRKKTDEDLEQIERIEWYGSLYLNENQQIVLPGLCLEMSMVYAARRSRLGKDFEIGLMVPNDALLEYDGAKNIDKLYAEQHTVDTRSVVVQKKRIQRTRALFRQWEAEFTIAYDPEILNEKQVRDTLELAGRYTHVGTYRQRHGGFEVTQWEPIDHATKKK